MRLIDADALTPKIIAVIEAEQENYTELKRELFRTALYVDAILECPDEQKKILIGFISRLIELMLYPLPEPYKEETEQSQYEELTPEEAASDIASGSIMSANYWLDVMILVKQMGYVICRKR